MPMRQIVGAALFAVGAALLFAAYRASNAPLEQITDAVTGRYTDQTMFYLIGGVGCAIAGGLMLALGRRG